MIKAIAVLFAIKFVIGVIPGIGATCTPDWIYPPCMFFGLIVHCCIYAMGTYLHRKEYLIQEDKIMAVADQSQSIMELDDFQRVELEKSERVLDKVALKSSFMKIFTK